MKKIFVSIIALVIVATGFQACKPSVKGEFFGEKITADGAVATSEVKKLMEGKDSVNVKLKGKINECCQKKGCWMTVDIGEGETMLVNFKDYGFFVPKDAGGKNTIMDGMLHKRVLSVEERRHLAEDEGQSEEEIAAINGSKEEYEFVANGVIIQ